MAKIKEAKDEERHRSGRQRRGDGRICRRFKFFLSIMFQFLRYLFDLFIDKVFGLYYDPRIEKVKGISNPIVLESANSLAQKIRNRQLTSEEVVSAFIQRIKEVNSLINAVVDDRFNEAIEEAKRIDKEIALGNYIDVDFDLKPFLGVPFTTKDSTACKGLSNTFGLISRKSRKALFDAECVERMKNAGAILIAVTNVPQLNLWQETSNPVYGRTNNPYNSTRNVGGSSGGEASLVAACGSPLSIGSDIGGSIRLPAFSCGVFGHKPTCGIVSTNGLTFRTGSEDETMVVAGPITRYVEDLIPFLKVLGKRHENKLKLDESVDIKQVKICYVANPNDPFVSALRKETIRSFFKVVNHFTHISEGRPQLLDIKDLKYGGKLWMYWMTQEPNANFNRDIANREGEVNGVLEILKYLIGQSNFNLAIIYNLINGYLPKKEGKWAKETTKRLKEDLIAAMGPNGVILYPSAPWPASYHYTAFFRPWNINLWAIWNALKFPVTQVPLGLGEDGLPLGIQVVAAPYNDHLCLAVARELEKTFGGYVPPFPVDK